MGNENDISGKVGLDITEFKNGVSQLNREIRVIESGFKAAAAGSEDWSKDTDTLKARIDSLSQIIELQRKKVELAKDAYEKVAAEKGATSKAAQDLAIKLNNETLALNKSELGLKKATASLERLSDESKVTEKQTADLARAMTDMGDKTARAADVAKKAVTAIGAAATGAAAGVFKLTVDAGKMADDLITLSNKTGISTQQLQEMEYAARFVDLEVETMTGSMMKLTKTMDQARDGNKNAEAAYKALGVEITNSDGSLRDSHTVWLEIINALGSVGNETERNALALQIFGKSAAELNPLIVSGGDSLAQLAAEASSLGIIMSDEAVISLGAFDDKMQVLDASTKVLGASVATAMLPVMDNLITIVQNLAQAAMENLVPAMENVAIWFQQSLTDGGLRWLIDNGNNIIALITGISAGMLAWNVVTTIQSVIAAIKAWQAATVGISLAQKALNLIMAANPIGLVITAIAALTAGILYLWNTNEGFRNAILNSWINIKEGVLNAIKEVKETIDQWKDIGSNIIDGMIEGIKAGVSKLINAIKSVITAAIKAAKSVLGISSPSKLFRDEVGFMIGAGMAQGITDSISTVNLAMSRLNKELTTDATVKLNAATNVNNNPLKQNELAGNINTGNIMHVTINVKSAAEATRELHILSKQLASQF